MKHLFLLGSLIVSMSFIPWSLSFAEEEPEDNLYIIGFLSGLCYPGDTGITLCMADYKFLKNKFCPELDETFQIQKENRKQDKENGEPSSSGPSLDEIET